MRAEQPTPTPSVIILQIFVSPEEFFFGTDLGGGGWNEAAAVLCYPLLLDNVCVWWGTPSWDLYLRGKVVEKYGVCACACVRGRMRESE